MEEIKEDTTKMNRLLGMKREEEKQCVLRDKTYEKMLIQPKAKYCKPYVTHSRFAAAGNLTECLLNVGKIDNRCNALRQCCEPAIRCETHSVHGELGRTIDGLREEINIKLADCRERKETRKVKSPSDENKDTKNTPLKQQILTQIPFILCEKYLECQKNIISMRSSCSRLQAEQNAGSDAIWTEHLLESNPIDSHDAFCRHRFSNWMEEVRRKREAAVEYMHKCVKVVDVSKELRELEQPPCDIDAMLEANVTSSIEKLTNDNCKMEILRQRSNCLHLRDCCLQADVCERSALYGALADEYLISKSELLDSLKACYFETNTLKKLL